MSAQCYISGLKRKAKDALSDDSDSDSEGPQLTEEESHSESDLECDDWDRNCRVVQISIKTNKIIGFHLMPTCLPESKLQEKNLTLNAKLNNIFLKEFKRHWKCDIAVNNEVFEIITSPWKACIIKELIADVSILKEIRQEFYELEWNRRRMDLYDFHQSRDLKYLNSNKIKSVYNFLKNNVLSLVSSVMDVELTKISATCSYYTDTDYLLLHDDRRGDRVIAFVLYLSDVYDWNQSWGGALELFNHDENYQPNCIEHSILPRNNQLVLFPVSNISYHQVGEVLTKNFSRLSINGWFHGKITPSKIQPVSPILRGLYSNIYRNSVVCDIDLKEYINEIFLMQDNIKDIQKHIEETSEISLPDFFKEDFFNKINHIFNEDLKWKIIGPPNRMHYEILEEINNAEILGTLINIFKSEVMFRLLEQYTELEFSNKSAGMKYELQRWSPGCYSLLSDYEWDKKQELDVILYFGCDKIVGGQIQYIAQEEEVQQALITLEHKNNSLNLVFRDSARINYLVSKHTNKPFYALVCSYTENNKT